MCMMNKQSYLIHTDTYIKGLHFYPERFIGFVEDKIKYGELVYTDPIRGIQLN